MQQTPFNATLFVPIYLVYLRRESDSGDCGVIVRGTPFRLRPGANVSLAETQSERRSASEKKCKVDANILRIKTTTSKT